MHSWFQALPTARTSPSSPLLKRDDLCGDYTYEDNTSGGSPLVSDCQQLGLIFLHLAIGGSITGFRTIASYGTCNFGVQQHTSYKTIFHVGNQDVEVLINNAISMYQWDGRVGAARYMVCPDDLGDIYNSVYWSLY